MQNPQERREFAQKNQSCYIFIIFLFFFVILQLMSPEILIKMFESFMELQPQYLLATIMPFPVSLWYLTIFSGIKIYERSRTI